MFFPRRSGVALLATAATLAAGALPAEAATYRAYGGSGYASTAKVGTLVSSGATSPASLCTTQVPTSSTNNTAKVDLGVVGTVGAATTKVSSAKTSSTKTSRSTTRVAATSLLGGLVRARAVTATATVTRRSSGYTRAGSSVFTDLWIGDRAVTAKPKPNTRIEIPDVATVVLNGQTQSTSFGEHRSSVIALRVTLLKDNRLGLPVGTVVVGSARATLHTPTHHRPYGSAYGTQLNAVGIVGSGRTAAVGLPCGGSSGKTLSNAVASVSAPGVLEAGAVRSTARSTDTSSATAAATTSSIAQVSLLGGVVTFDAVDVHATATRKGTSVSRSSRGTKVTGLMINGKPVSVSTGENTKVSIAGLGTLHLRRVVRTTTGLQVYGAQLVLSSDWAGLTKGTTLTVGSASAGVTYH